MERDQLGAPLLFVSSLLLCSLARLARRRSLSHSRLNENEKDVKLFQRDKEESRKFLSLLRALLVESEAAPETLEHIFFGRPADDVLEEDIDTSDVGIWTTLLSVIQKEIAVQQRPETLRLKSGWSALNLTLEACMPQSLFVCWVSQGGALVYSHLLAAASVKPASVVLDTESHCAGTIHPLAFVCFNAPILPASLLPSTLFDIDRDDLLFLFLIPSFVYNLREHAPCMQINVRLQHKKLNGFSNQVKVQVKKRAAGFSSSTTYWKYDHVKENDKYLPLSPSLFPNSDQASVNINRSLSSSKSRRQDILFAHSDCDSLTTRQSFTPETTRKELPSMSNGNMASIALEGEQNYSSEDDFYVRGRRTIKGSSPISPLLSFSDLPEFQPLSPSALPQPSPLSSPHGPSLSHKSTSLLEEPSPLTTSDSIDNPGADIQNVESLHSPLSLISHSADLNEKVNNKETSDDSDENFNKNNEDRRNHMVVADVPADRKVTAVAVVDTQSPPIETKSQRKNMTRDTTKKFDDLNKVTATRVNTQNGTPAARGRGPGGAESRSFTATLPRAVAVRKEQGTIDDKVVVSGTPTEPPVSGLFDNLLWAVMGALTSADSTQLRDIASSVSENESECGSGPCSRSSSYDSLVDLNSNISPVESS